MAVSSRQLRRALQKLPLSQHPTGLEGREIDALLKQIRDRGGGHPVPDIGHLKK